MLFGNWNHSASCCMFPILSLRMFEFFFIISTIPFFCLFCYALYVHRVFHANLRLILIMITVNDMIICGLRGVEILTDFTGNPQLGFAFSLRRLWQLSSATLVLLLALERVAAVVGGMHRRNEFPIFTSIGTIVGLTFIVVIHYLREKKYIGAVEILSLYSLCPITGVLVFCVLPFLTKRRYRSTLAKRFEYKDGGTLARRYEATENVRTLRVLKCYIPFMAVSILFNLIWLVITYTYIIRHHRHRLLLFQSILYAVTAPRVVGCMAIVLVFHETLNRHVRRLLGMKSTENGAVLRNVEGIRLSFTPRNEQQIYFDSYLTAWS